jgi:nucleotide-binding universal stress UspA family protein
MNQSKPSAFPIHRIVHPTDLSHGSEVAFTHALKLAVGLRAKLDIVHVDARADCVIHEDFPSVHDTLARWGLLSEDASRDQVAELGIHVHKSAPYDRDPVRGLLKYLRKHPADLVVLATHRRHGLARWLHQQIGEQLLKLTRVPTLFVPYNVPGFVDLQRGTCSLNRVVLPVAREPNPQPAVDALSVILHGLGDVSPTTTICHFGDEEADAPMLHYPHDRDWQWEWLIREGETVETIIEVCEQKSADLLAMTTDGHHGFLDALRGTTTERVLHQATCPMLVVPTPQVTAEDLTWSRRAVPQRA